MFRLQFAQPYVNGTHTSNDNSISDDWVVSSVTPRDTDELFPVTGHSSTSGLHCTAEHITGYGDLALAMYI